MVAFATVLILSTFVTGSSMCFLALWTIHKSNSSFGVLCKYQMLTDLSLLLLTTVYSLLPIEYAPPDNSPISIAVTSIGEIFYFFSGEMHDLFAVNRFVYIVFPTMKQAWRNATPKILIIGALFATFRTFLMMWFDVNLYWVYDRPINIWHMTHTEWTEFYEKYFEVYWSVGEIIFILMLDSVTFAFLLLSKSKLNDSEVQMNRRAETRLILQSFCQCIPTTTVTIIYFFIFPYTTDPNVLIVFASMWIMANILDAIIIILFHFPQALASHRKRNNMTPVTAITTSNFPELNSKNMVQFATAAVIWTFLIGNGLSCIALWTIHMSKTLRDSFGFICKYQMMSDLTLVSLATIYTLIPTSIAPPSDSPLSFMATSIGEVCFFYSAEMHYLFALNRFVCIVFPEKKQGWRRATPKILIFCASLAVVRTFIMSMFDPNLYWVYDRKISVWHMTHTPWTDFYEEYLEVYWSMCEIAFIMILDGITFGHLFSSKSKINNGAVRVNRRAEIRLILQSLCQCLPTTTVTIVYFFVFRKTDGHINWGESWFLPLREEQGVIKASEILIFLSCSWYIANSLDSYVGVLFSVINLLCRIIIIVFHFPQALTSYRKKIGGVVTMMTMTSAA